MTRTTDTRAHRTRTKNPFSHRFGHNNISQCDDLYFTACARARWPRPLAESHRCRLFLSFSPLIMWIIKIMSFIMAIAAIQFRWFVATPAPVRPPRIVLYHYSPFVLNSGLRTQANTVWSVKKEIPLLTTNEQCFMVTHYDRAIRSSVLFSFFSLQPQQMDLCPQLQIQWHTHSATDVLNGQKSARNPKLTTEKRANRTQWDCSLCLCPCPSHNKITLHINKELIKSGWMQKRKREWAVSRLPLFDGRMNNNRIIIWQIMAIAAHLSTTISPKYY